jgi:hypothetical protein
MIRTAATHMRSQVGHSVVRFFGGSVSSCVPVGIVGRFVGFDQEKLPKP